MDHQPEKDKRKLPGGISGSFPPSSLHNVKSLNHTTDLTDSEEEMTAEDSCFAVREDVSLKLVVSSTDGSFANCADDGEKQNLPPPSSIETEPHAWHEDKENIVGNLAITVEASQCFKPLSTKAAGFLSAGDDRYFGCGEENLSPPLQEKNRNDSSITNDSMAKNGDSQEDCTEQQAVPMDIDDTEQSPPPLGLPAATTASSAAPANANPAKITPGLTLMKSPSYNPKIDAKLIALYNSMGKVRVTQSSPAAESNQTEDCSLENAHSLPPRDPPPSPARQITPNPRSAAMTSEALPYGTNPRIDAKLIAMCNRREAAGPSNDRDTTTRPSTTKTPLPCLALPCGTNPNVDAKLIALYNSRAAAKTKVNANNSNNNRGMATRSSAAKKSSTKTNFACGLNVLATLPMSCCGGGKTLKVVTQETAITSASSSPLLDRSFYGDNTGDKSVKCGLNGGYRGDGPTFPRRLHRMVTELSESRPGIAQWAEDGGAFILNCENVHEGKLSQVIAPFFGYSYYLFKSFRRQLNAYGWKKPRTGPYKGMVYHPLFHRDGLEQLSKIRKTNGTIPSQFAMKKQGKESLKIRIPRARMPGKQPKPMYAKKEKPLAEKSEQHPSEEGVLAYPKHVSAASTAMNLGVAAARPRCGVRVPFGVDVVPKVAGLSALATVAGIVRRPLTSALAIFSPFKPARLVVSSPSSMDQEDDIQNKKGVACTSGRMSIEAPPGVATCTTGCRFLHLQPPPPSLVDAPVPPPRVCLPLKAEAGVPPVRWSEPLTNVEQNAATTMATSQTEGVLARPPQNVVVWNDHRASRVASFVQCDGVPFSVTPIKIGSGSASAFAPVEVSCPTASPAFFQPFLGMTGALQSALGVTEEDSNSNTVTYGDVVGV